MSSCLRDGCRYPLDWLFRWSQHDQSYANDNEESHAHQFSAWDQIKRCLHRHHRTMSKTRPCRESDQAAIRGWVAGCQQQENAERYVKAHHHRQRGVLPDKHHQGINTSRKEQSHQHQHDLERPFSPHCGLLINPTLVANFFAMDVTRGLFLCQQGTCFLKLRSVSISVLAHGQELGVVGLRLLIISRSEEHTSELQSLRHLVCR